MITEIENEELIQHLLILRGSVREIVFALFFFILQEKCIMTMYEQDRKAIKSYCRIKVTKSSLCNRNLLQLFPILDKKHISVHLLKKLSREEKSYCK